MSIESCQYKCRICHKKSEVPYLKIKNDLEPVHICSQRCHRLFQMFMNQTSQAYVEAMQSLQIVKKAIVIKEKA